MLRYTKIIDEFNCPNSIRLDITIFLAISSPYLDNFDKTLCFFLISNKYFNFNKIKKFSLKLNRFKTVIVSSIAIRQSSDN